MTPEEAMKQASMTSSDYATKALDDLCRMLGLHQRGKDWQAQIAPFAPVWAAMIAAAASDFATSLASGVVEGTTAKMTHRR